MNNSIIVSGCSYSNVNKYSSILEQKNLSVVNLAFNGQSNEIIMKKIYDYIKKYNSKNSLFICQLTYLHRIGFYHEVEKKWLDYQPRSFNNMPYLDENGEVMFEFNKKDTHFNKSSLNLYLDDLQKFYQTYLEYIFDEEYEFSHLMYKVDLLKSFVKETGNDILFIYWPNIKKNQIDDCKSRDFFHFNNEYSMLKWTTEKEIVMGDSHLSKDGSKFFANTLYDYINNERYIKYSI